MYLWAVFLCLAVIARNGDLSTASGWITLQKLGAGYPGTSHEQKLLCPLGCFYPANEITLTQSRFSDVCQVSVSCLQPLTMFKIKCLLVADTTWHETGSSETRDYSDSSNVCSVPPFEGTFTSCILNSRKCKNFEWSFRKEIHSLPSQHNLCKHLLALQSAFIPFILSL